MRAAAIQLRSGTQVADNIAQASDLIRAAVAEGARFVATPEMTHLLQKDAQALRASVRPMEDDLGVAGFSDLAQRLGIYLLIGSLAILRPDGKIANRSLLFAPDGALVAQYDKIHLFEAQLSDAETYREADHYVAGTDPVMVDLQQDLKTGLKLGLKLGLSICYDLRFPALYGGYGRQGVDLIAVPAAFTVPTGRAHWESLLRARAIETGAYVIAPAQGGLHADGRRCWGHSQIIGPWGEIVAALDHDEPAYVLADIDQTAITKARTKLPAWKHQ